MARRDSDVDSSGMQNLLDTKSVNLDNCRKLVKSYIDLVSTGFYDNSNVKLLVS